MIERLTLENFRLFKDASIDFASGVPTVLIGPNASGKSSVIEALDIVSELMRKNVSEVFDTAGRGGVKRVVRTGAPNDRFKIELCLSAFSGEWKSVQKDEGMVYRLWFSQFQGASGVMLEELLQMGADSSTPIAFKASGHEAWLLQDVAESSDLSKRDEATASPDRLLMLNAVSEIHHKRADKVKSLLSSFAMYSSFAVTPEWAKSRHDGRESPRDPFAANQSERLERRGYNLPATLHSLSSDRNPKWKRILWHWQQEFPFVEDLLFPPSGGLLAPIWIHKDYPEERLSFSQMSDGMLSMLCLLTALFQPHDAAIYCFDEPEQHLHPSLIRRFVMAAEEAARELDRRILIVTHSDRLLDYLSDPAKSLRIASSDGNEAKIEKVDEDAMEAWLEHYTLSQLRARGQLDPLSNDEY